MEREPRGAKGVIPRTFGEGHWSRTFTERAVSRDLKTSRVLVVRRGPSIVATMTLDTKKPWAAAAGAGEFYAKCGFREVGRVTYRTVPLVYFELLR